MKKVELNMREMEKYKVIRELYEHAGDRQRAAERLGISRRQVNRLLKRYADKGKAGFVHGNRNRHPSNSLPQELDDQIIRLYRDVYQGFNFRHFTEKLHEAEGIPVSYGTVYQILVNAGIYPPRAHRASRRKWARQLIRQNRPGMDGEDLETAVSHVMDLEDSHPRKARAKYFGEEIQMDGSIHPWFGSRKACLHLSIDNATGTVTAGWFDWQETLNGYYHVFKQILENYGIPAKFLTDNRTVFHYENCRRRTDDMDVLTQFGYACRILGVQLETSSVSQYKGQIERANATFQDRLVNELRLEGISTIEAANDYLIRVFIPAFNRRFALDPRTFDSVMEASPSAKRINETLAVLSPRKFDSGSAVSYMGGYYQAYNAYDRLVCFRSHTECLVIRAFDGTLYVSVDGNVYLLRPLLRNRHDSDAFDLTPQPAKARRVYIPPKNHPWRTPSFLKYRDKAHSDHSYA